MMVGKGLDLVFILMKLHVCYVSNIGGGGGSQVLNESRQTNLKHVDSMPTDYNVY